MSAFDATSNLFGLDRRPAAARAGPRGRPGGNRWRQQFGVGLRPWRVTGLGGRPSSSEIRFSTRAIWRSISGIATAVCSRSARIAVELQTIRHAAVKTIPEIGDRFVVEAEGFPPRFASAGRARATGNSWSRRPPTSVTMHAPPPLLARERERKSPIPARAVAARTGRSPTTAGSGRPRSGGWCRRSLVRRRRPPDAVARPSASTWG